MIYDSKVQEKLYGVLNDLGIPVYDFVPTNSEFPYVRIDSCYFMDNSTKAEEGITLIQYVQVFSDYRGKKEIRDLVAQMNDLVLNANYEDEEIQIFVEMEIVRYFEHQEKDGSGYYNQATVMYKFTIFER
jgi:hypothetical protein